MTEHPALADDRSATPALIVALPGAREARAQLAFDPFDVDTITAYAQELEALGVAALLLGDAPLDTGALNVPDVAAPALALETFTAASYLAVNTTRLGIVTTVNVNYREPFAFARLIASLDHVSDGRCGWLLSIAESGNAASNHQMASTPTATRLQRAAESLQVIRGLLETWKPGAFIRDKDSGQFIDATQVGFLDHKGDHFQVRGPLNVAPTPQRFPPVFLDLAQESELSALSAHADVLLVDKKRLEGNPTHLSASGNASMQRVFRRVQPFLADSLLEAHALSMTQAAREGDNRFIGTWEDWGNITSRERCGSFGIVIDLPDAKALDLPYVRRVITATRSTAADAPRNLPDIGHWQQYGLRGLLGLAPHLSPGQSV